MRAASTATHQPSSSRAITCRPSAVSSVKRGGTRSPGCRTTVNRQQTASQRLQSALSVGDACIVMHAAGANGGHRVGRLRCRDAASAWALPESRRPGGWGGAWKEAQRTTMGAVGRDAAGGTGASYACARACSLTSRWFPTGGAGTKKPARGRLSINLVGGAGFEPATLAV